MGVMAPPIKIAGTPPPRPSAPPPTQAQLAQEVGDASVALQNLKSDSKSKPAAIAAAQQRLDIATGALDAQVSQSTTTADSRADAAKIYASIETAQKNQPALTNARVAAGAEIAQANKDSDLPAPGPKATIAQLQAHQKKLAAAETKLKSAMAKYDKALAAETAGTATIASLSKQLTTRENTTLATTKSQTNDPSISDLQDTADVASRTRAEQIKIVGAPVVNVSVDQAAAVDRNKVSVATKSSLASGAKMLDLQLQGADSYQQQKLIDSAAGHIETMSKMAWLDKKVAAPLMDALATAQGGARTALGLQIAKAATVAPNAIFTELDSRMQQGDSKGFEAARELSFQLRKTGRPDLADKIEGMAASRMGELREKFTGAESKVAKANGDLARLTAGFGPMLTDKEKMAAIDAFKARHQSEYTAWENAGAKLASALPFATTDSKYGGKLGEESQKVLELLPNITDTKGGDAALTKALEAQKKGEPTFLDQVPLAMKNMKNGQKFIGSMTTAIAKNVGARAMELVAANKLTEAEGLLTSLNTNAKLLGIDAEPMKKITDKLKDVFHGKAGSYEALELQLTKTKGATPLFTERGGQALKGLGLVLGIAGNVDQWKKGGLQNNVTAAAQSLNIGVDGGILAMEVMGKAAQFTKLMNFAKGASGGLNAVGAVMDGITAVQAFREGKYAEGVASSASSVGGAILATAAISAAAGAQVVPVAGQVVGAVLVAVGTVGKMILDNRAAAKAEKKDEDDAQAFLEAAGIDPARADELSDLKRSDGRNVGSFIQALAADLKMSPADLFAQLKKLSPDQLNEIVDMAKDLPLDDKGQYLKTASNDDMALSPRMGESLQGQTGGYMGPRSIHAAEAWMRSEGLLPAGK